MTISIEENYIKLYNFLKNPKDLKDENQSISHKIDVFLSLLLLDIPLMFLLAVFLVSFEEMGWIESGNHKVEEFLKNNSKIVIFLFVVVLGPFIEELIFRLFLRLKRNYFFQFLIYIFPNLKYKILEFWVKKYLYVFYFSVIKFAFVHITNYEIEISKFYLFPVLVLPQFFAGIFLGYLSVKYNFMLGFLFHAIHNAILIIPSLLMH